MAAPAITGALAAMLQQSGELDDIISGRGLRFERTPEPPPAPPAPTFYIPPPDWHAEAAERAALEREQQQHERDRLLAEELARLESAASLQPRPAPKQHRWLRSSA